MSHDQAAVLSAFLTPPSRILASSDKQSSSRQLTPQEISQKVASIVRPGPPFYSTVSSADLIDNLSNASIMRCDSLQPRDEPPPVKSATDSDGKDKDGKPTVAATWTGVGNVWSALEALPSGPATWQIPSSNPQRGTTEAAAAAAKKQAEDDNDDGLWSSVMFACDIHGKDVELTKSCVVPTHILVQHHYYAGNRTALFTSVGAGTTYAWDDFSDPIHHCQPAQNTSYTSLLSLYTFPATSFWWSIPSWVPYFGSSTKDSGGNAIQPANPPAKTNPKAAKRVWVPSTTKVSVRASWWGYTIFLPSAVMPELEADVDQAEKIAQIVHTVLTTILDNASKVPLPLNLQAAVLLLKSIAPATSYIATFIGWSWDEIKSFDKGQGVELSATWLLPIALIPHTWDAATSPDDKNNDGVPDGPPVQTPMPVEPAPSNPAPATPAPADPAPATPAPTNPTPVTPAPTEPAPVTPAPADPAPVTPAPAEPAPTEPAPTTPAPVDPQPATTAPAEPAPVPANVAAASESGYAPTLASLEPVSASTIIAASTQESETPAVSAPSIIVEVPAEAQAEESTAAPAAPVADPVDATPAAPVVTEPAAPTTPAPNAPEGDATGRGALDLPAMGDAPSPDTVPLNDGVEWTAQSAEPTKPITAADKGKERAFEPKSVLLPVDANTLAVPEMSSSSPSSASTSVDSALSVGQTKSTPKAKGKSSGARKLLGKMNLKV